MDDTSDLLAALQAFPDSLVNSPSDTFTEYLARIENDVPSLEAFGEDNMGEGWGHKQFSGGALTLTSVIDSWQSVGSPANACRILAAAIRICRVARFLCADRTPQPCYVADSYLNNLIKSLWTCWRAADGVIFHQLIFLLQF